MPEEELGDVLEPENADNGRTDSDSVIRPQEVDEQAQAEFFDKFADWARRVQAACADYIADTQASSEAVQTNQTSSLPSNSSTKPCGTGLILPPRASTSVVGESMADKRAWTPRPSYLPEGAVALRDRMGEFSESDDDVRDQDYHPSKESREVSEDSCPHSESGTGQLPETATRHVRKTAAILAESPEGVRVRLQPQPKVRVRYLVAQFLPALMFGGTCEVPLLNGTARCWSLEKGTSARTHCHPVLAVGRSKARW